MNGNNFDPMEFYSSYPSKVISRPGYPARAVFKSALMFSLFGKRIFSGITEITNYADIGGCFGFGANSMAFHIQKLQGTLPRTVVFEISSEFVEIGKILFPHIEFVQTEFCHWNGDIKFFDLVTLFDVVEHVVDPESFLRHISARARYVMLKTPMETSGEWRANRPPLKQGEKHEDGHINFFSPKTYERLLKKSNLDIIKSNLISTIIPSGAYMALNPEFPEPEPPGLLNSHPKRLFLWALRKFPGVPWYLKRKLLGGGDHICLCKSKLFHQ